MAIVERPFLTAPELAPTFDVTSWVLRVHAYGARNAKGDPLQTDTVMYGASLTAA
jgi:hypothetical protein